MQPLQGVLQHHVHIHAATTIRFATARCRTPWRNQSHVNTKSPYPPPTQAALHRRSHFTRKKCDVSCSGFLPNTSPMQHSCSHCNAFCSTTCTFMRRLQCDLQPFIIGSIHFTRKNAMFRAQRFPQSPPPPSHHFFQPPLALVTTSLP